MKKTIAFQIGHFPSASETFIVSNILYAIKQGYNVKVFCTRFLGMVHSSQQETLEQCHVNKLVFPPIHPKKNTFAKLLQLLSFLINPRNLFYVLRYNSFKSKGFFNCAFKLKQYEHMSYNQVIHVHFNNSLKPLMDVAAIGYIKPKVIITFHGYDAFLECKESFQHKYGDFYENYVKVVTVNSSYLKNEVLKLGIENQPITIVPIGIDNTIFQGEPKIITANQQIQLLTVGRLVQIKGHTYGLRTVKRLKDLGYNVHYTIVGEGDKRSHLVQEIESHGIGDQVSIIGEVSQDDVKNYMNKSHMFLMTSTFDDNTRRQEAFGLVSVEAQAMGLPVIGFKSGGFPDTIIEGETGFAVEERNVLELTEKIMALIDHPDLYKKMSVSAIAHAATFDSSVTTQHYLDLYDALFELT